MNLGNKQVNQGKQGSDKTTVENLWANHWTFLKIIGKLWLLTIWCTQF